jgi:biopolymer transport protein ExbD
VESLNTLEPLHLQNAWDASVWDVRCLQWIPIANVLLLAFGLLCLSSKWLCPTGMQLTLPKITPTLAYETALPLDDILWMDAESRVVFHRKMYDFSQLDRAFQASDGSTLLLNIDERVAWKQVLRVIECAKAHGYTSVQIGVHEKQPSEP